MKFKTGEKVYVCDENFNGGEEWFERIFDHMKEHLYVDSLGQEWECCIKNKKKLYRVSEKDADGEYLLIVANNSKQAKKIGDGELSCDWIDLKVSWIRGVNVDKYQTGVFTDTITALKKGWYQWIGETCPVCKQDTHIEYEIETNMFVCTFCGETFKEF